MLLAQVFDQLPRLRHLDRVDPERRFVQNHDTRLVDNRLGDADPLAESNTLSVGLTEVQTKAVNALNLASAVFTPNGDQVNDVLSIEYELLNLFGSVPVALDLYDLSGRRVGAVYRGTAASGRFALGWDGVLANGSVAAPGLYLLRLQVASDRGVETLQRVISLAY